RGLNKVKRELGFVLMALNIRKVVAQRAENNQKIYKKDNFYIILIEIVFFSLIQELYVPDSFLSYFNTSCSIICNTPCSSLLGATAFATSNSDLS
ncbi:hypothetical protein MX641_11045, partial [Staphylococcus haemolyticus]|nr:hypothetical protein [Staphylococcus haemolyticus]